MREQKSFSSDNPAPSEGWSFTDRSGAGLDLPHPPNYCRISSRGLELSDKYESIGKPSVGEVSAERVTMAGTKKLTRNIAR